MKSNRFKIKNWGKDGSYSIQKELDSLSIKFKAKKRKAKRKPNEQ